MLRYGEGMAKSAAGGGWEGTKEDSLRAVSIAFVVYFALRETGAVLGDPQGAAGPIRAQPGAYRAAQYSRFWQRVSLRQTVERIAGPSPRVRELPGGKVEYTNPSNGMRVVYDKGGDYFRVQDAGGGYLDQFGTPIPNNVSLVSPPNGRVTQTGVPNEVRQALTHFSNSDT